MRKIAKKILSILMVVLLIGAMQLPSFAWWPPYLALHPETGEPCLPIIYASMGFTSDFLSVKSSDGSWVHQMYFPSLDGDGSDFMLTPCSFNPATSTFYEGAKDENGLLSFYPKTNNEGILCTTIEYKSRMDGEVIITPDFTAGYPGVKCALDFHDGQPIKVFDSYGCSYIPVTGAASDIPDVDGDCVLSREEDTAGILAGTPVQCDCCHSNRLPVYMEETGLITVYMWLEGQDPVSSTGTPTHYSTFLYLDAEFDFDTHMHIYDEIVSYVEATCTTDGYVTTRCVCGDTTTDVQPAYGHFFKSVVTPPTFDAPGTTTYTCYECGYSYTEESASKLLGGTVSVGSGRAMPGEIITLPIAVDPGDTQGIVATHAVLHYDTSKLELVEATNGTLFPDGSMTAGKDISAMPYHIIWENALSHENYGAGDLGTLKFRVLDGVEPCDTQVSIEFVDRDTFDTNLQMVPYQGTNGTVTIYDRTPADADGDGNVSLKDVAFITRYLVGGWDITINEKNADVNGDHQVDLMDVALIRRYLAGGWNITLQ